MEDVYTSEIDALISRQIMPGAESSAEWMRKLTPQMRAKAFFSARVESAGLLSRMKKELQSFLNEEVEDVEGPDGITRTALKADGKATFIERMRNYMLKEGIASEAESPEGRGAVTDLPSTTRLELIFQTLTRQAHGFAEWRQSMEPDILRAYPARRFVRIPGAEDPRLRHVESEGDVRLKTDFDYWALYQNGEDIGGFEVPWEPFGFNSYMTTEAVSRSEARSLGLLKKEENVEPPQDMDTYLTEVKASTSRIEPTIVNKLKAALGSIASISGSVISLIRPGASALNQSKFAVFGNSSPQVKEVVEQFLKSEIELDDAINAIRKVTSYDGDWLAQTLTALKAQQ